MGRSTRPQVAALVIAQAGFVTALTIASGVLATGSGCGARTPSFLGQPLPEHCREQSELSHSRRCLGWILDRAFVARAHRYRQPALEQYVTSVGQRLGTAVERADITWTFRILDDASIQAYALVGGYVYVSRGTLAVLDSEAELAALMAHEMAHVAAGHSEDTILALADAASEYDQLFAHYFERERDEERQADELAARYLRRAGYEPRALLTMLGRIHRDWQLVDESQPDADQPADEPSADEPDDKPNQDASSEAGYDWRRTHPPGPVRRARVARVIAGWKAGELGRGRYRMAIDGLVVGRDPRTGYLAGQTFIHVQAGLRLRLADSWHLTLTEQSVRALSERAGQTLFATMMPIGVGHYHFFREGMTQRTTKTLAGRRMTVGWLTPAATSALSATTEVDEVRHLRAGLVAADDSYLLILVAGAERDTVTAGFAEVARGFGVVTASDIRSARPARIANEPAPRAASVGELAAELCPDSTALTIELEGGDGDAPRARGELIRCVRRAGD